MSIDYFIVQCNIKSLLALRKEKQSDFAKSIGVLPRTVNRWIRGVNGKPVQIPRPQLHTIAEYFGISYEALIDPEKFANEAIFNGEMTYFDDLIALENYLTSIGCELNYSDISRVAVINVAGKDLKFGKPEIIHITWKNEAGKAITKDISYTSFETFARKLKALAMLEIKYIK